MVEHARPGRLGGRALPRPILPAQVGWWADHHTSRAPSSAADHLGSRTDGSRCRAWVAASPCHRGGNVPSGGYVGWHGRSNHRSCPRREAGRCRHSPLRPPDRRRRRVHHPVLRPSRTVRVGLDSRRGNRRPSLGRRPTTLAPGRFARRQRLGRSGHHPWQTTAHPGPVGRLGARPSDLDHPERRESVVDRNVGLDACLGKAGLRCGCGRLLAVVDHRQPRATGRSARSRSDLSGTSLRSAADSGFSLINRAMTATVRALSRSQVAAVPPRPAHIGDLDSVDHQLAALRPITSSHARRGSRGSVCHPTASAAEYRQTSTR
jgi:hypothetical protein